MVEHTKYDNLLRDFVWWWTMIIRFWRYVRLSCLNVPQSYKIAYPDLQHASAHFIHWKQSASLPETAEWRVSTITWLLRHRGAEINLPLSRSPH
jgi:hypothetical protein